MTTARAGLFLRIANTMLARRAACLSAQLAGRALASEPALHCTRGAHGGRPDRDVHATTVLCVRKDGQASVGWAAAAATAAWFGLELRLYLLALQAGGAGGGWPGDHGWHGGEAQRAQDAQDWGARDRRLCRCGGRHGHANVQEVPLAASGWMRELRFLLPGSSPDAGATADALTLFERLETKLEEHSGQLTRWGVGLSFEALPASTWSARGQTANCWSHH